MRLSLRGPAIVRAGDLPFAIGILLGIGLTGGVPGSQAQAGPSEIRGSVTDTAGTPISNARVSITSLRRQAWTGGDGAFQLSSLPAGELILEVRHPGFAAQTIPLAIGGDEVQEIAIRLGIEPLPLASVEVHATRQKSPQLREFMERRQRGGGHFLTREEIERIQPRVFTDILRRVPGLDLRSIDGAFGSGEQASMRRTRGMSGARECRILYYIDGRPVPITRDHSVDSVIRPGEIEAVEVYSGASTIPSRFHATGHGARCGVIAIWTRRGPGA